MIAEYIIISLLTIISSSILIRTLRIVNATRRRDIITDDIAGSCESLGFVGCSVICSGVKDIEHITELLGQDYDRYEVIVVLDSTLYPDEFRTITAHYRMIRVNCSPNDELPTAVIRNLYRSRQRSFRRLILVDREFLDIYHDLDAATAVASYNYLLPLGHDMHLCNKAMESIAIALSEQAEQRIELFFSPTTESYIFRRDAVISAGGFSPHIIRQIPSALRLKTYTPLTFKDKQPISRLPNIAILAALLALAYSLSGYIAVAAVAVTIILIISSARYTSRLISPANCSLQVMLCYFRQIGSIFQTRKFRIS